MMESADGGFGAGVDVPDDDPFAETTAQEFRQDDPLADPLAGAEEETLPVVNAEGEKVGEAPVSAGAPVESDAEREMRENAEAEMDAAREQAEAQAHEESALLHESEADSAAAAGDGDRQASELAEAAKERAEVPQSAPTAGGETASSAASTETNSAVDLNAAALPAEGSPAATDPPAAEDPASSATQKSQPETQPSPAAQAASAAATSPGDAGPSSASATQVTEAGAPDAAPMPEERKDKSGATTHRRYVLLVPDGDGRHRELVWYEDKTGKMVKKGSAGAKKQSVVLARNQEEALEMAFLAAGSPAGGVSVRAVPYSYWGKLTRVELDEDPPVRQRLKIRR